MKIFNKKNLNLLAVSVMASILVILGLIYTIFVWNNSVVVTSREALKMATVSAVSLNGEMLKQLKATPDEVGTTAYESIKSRLIEIRHIDKDIRFAYLLVKKFDKIYFIADSESVSSADYSPPGQEFAEADPQIYQSFTSGQPIITSPATDRWGTWVSVLVPIINSETGEVRAVFGMDYPEKYWSSAILYHTLQAGIIIVVLLLLLVFFYFLVRSILRFKESEQKFRAFTDSTKDAVVIMNGKGLVVLWNKTAENMFGYKEVEMLGKEFHKYITVNKAHQKKNNILQFGQTGESSVLGRLIELPVKDRFGKEFTIELSVSRTLIDGEWHAIGIMRDVTSRKNNEELLKQSVEEIKIKSIKTETQQKAILNILEDVAEEKSKTELLAKDLEKFKLAVDNASDHIVITDADGTIVYANKGVEKVTGFKVSEVFGKKSGNKNNWGGLMPKEYYEKMWDIIKNKKQVFVGDLKNRRKNGEEYEVVASISPILDAGGNVLFFVGIERDITKEKQIDRSKTEFVSLASHQLRTPLSAINWYTEMLLNGDAGKINSEQKQYLEEVYRGNQRMVELVNSLLNVSRLELGTFMIEPELIDLSVLAGDTIKELQPQIIEKKIKIKESYDKAIGKYSADPKLMKIIFQNLLSNAVKYTPENGKVDVSVAKDSKSVLITVKDNGYGITASQQDKIFTKLFRADNVREKDTEGTGLGLYLVKSIVDSASGKVWFESVENKGSTFYVSLPISGMKKKEGTKELN